MEKIPMLPHAKWEPPYPAFSATFAPDVRHVVMAYYGIRYEGDTHPVAAVAFAGRMRQASPHGPDIINRARHDLGNGHTEDIFILYWLDRGRFKAWQAALEPWWHHSERLHDSISYWREVFLPPLDCLETLISSDVPAGLAEAMTKVTGPIREHAYWGAMRDRIPASATDSFESSMAALKRPNQRPSQGRRLRVVAPENLCLIRSGQDLTDCGPEEAQFYAANVGPVLATGMAYLRDHPEETGCLSCRFVEQTDLDGGRQPKTFATAYFLSMTDLEEWAANHPTHLAIFRTFHELVRSRNFVLDLKLWHEVAVIPADGAVGEYINCPPDTGLLAFLPAVEF